jgi:hypothetical protein
MQNERHLEVSGGQCTTCHLGQALRAENPPHDGPLIAECSDCHDELAWHPAPGFDHAQHFELSGAHADTACTGCHANGFEAGQPTSGCFDCHEDDYRGSSFAGHETFPTSCGDCHAEDAWKPARLPDHERFFPLDGAHARVQCASCHTAGYQPGTTPKDCVGCHREDYDRSPYPGHTDFPTTCGDCHSTSAWTPASGGTHPETEFPITTGPHKEAECLECHDQALGPMGAGNTDCVRCHARSKADDQHDEVGDYPSGAAPVNFCLDCHPSGRKEDD